MTRILVIDNYDSFVYTLNGYLQELGAETVVVRNDQIPLAELDATLAEYDGVLVSPGPGKPSDAGVSIAAVHSARKQGIPLLGVCLGHQAIGEAFGATGSRAIEAIVVISFFSCALSLQAAASRLIYSYARDEMIFARKALSRINTNTGIAPVALAVAAVLPIISVLLDLVLPGGIFR